MRVFQPNAVTISRYTGGGVIASVFGTTPDRPRIGATAQVLAATSLVVWVAAITAGRLMAYVYAS